MYIALQILAILISLLVLFQVVSLSDAVFKLQMQVEKLKIRLSKAESRQCNCKPVKDKLSEL